MAYIKFYDYNIIIIYLQGTPSFIVIGDFPVCKSVKINVLMVKNSDFPVPFLSNCLQQEDFSVCADQDQF